MVTRLSEEDFATVERLAPFVSIDFIIENVVGKVLLGKRTNEPARGFWFVPGGIILKGETIDEAGRRISIQETGHEFLPSHGALLCASDHIYDQRHYVVLAYHFMSKNAPLGSFIDTQHSEWRWASIEEILSDDSVHPLARAYFR